VDAIRPTQDMMMQMSRSVDDTNETLRRVREVHEALLPVLETLRQPMELRMVPASRKPEGNSD